MFMQISTILATVLFLVIRSCDRGAWEVSFDNGDVHKDFVSAFTTQFKLTFMMMSWSPAISNALLLLIFFQSEEEKFGEQQSALMI